jgi:predicted nuclease of predicted toxin-antitoxin system
VRILLDECLPARLARALVGHEVRSVPDMGWSGRRNDELLQLAEREFDAFLTVDRNLSAQQDVNRFKIAVVVMVAKTNQLRDLQLLVGQVLEVCPYLMPGQVVKVA